MDEPAATFLISHAGQPLLARAAALPGDKSARVLALRTDKTVSPNVAALAAEIAAARERAARRGFADADRLFFTADALAQATSPALAAYRAGYLAGFGTVADLCCGAGVDATALAQAGATVIAVDSDPVRLLFARANAEVRGVAHRITFLHEPVEDLGWIGANAAFFDPARRSAPDRGNVAERVSRHGERYAPPLGFLHTIKAHVHGGCAKLSPALPDDVLRELSPSRVEFLSENRECKEACVWFGAATGASGAGNDFAAVLLGGDAVLHFAPDFAPLPPQPSAGGQRSGRQPTETFLLDPNPAIIRAGLLDALCETANATFVCNADSYLQSDAAPTGDAAQWASAYRVIHTLTYAPKKVGAWLRENGYARVVVKKRHFAQEPDAVAKDCGVSVRGDGREITLVLVRESANRFVAVLCEPVATPLPPPA